MCKPDSIRPYSSSSVIHPCRAAAGFLFAITALLVACDADEGGKYFTGRDDPALHVTEADLEQVEEVNERQRELDIARGLRKETTTPASSHPDIETADAPQPVDLTPLRAGGSGGGTFTSAYLNGSIPEGWVAERPSSSMRLAQIRIPRSPGDPEDGLLTVNFFPGGGGGIEANLNRWYGQFSQPDGRPSSTVARSEDSQVAGMQVVMINLPGTMEPSSMPSGPKVRRENWRMLAAIVVTSQGPVFFKGTGPDQTMSDNVAKMREFLRSMRPPGARVAAEPAVSSRPPASAQSAPASGGEFDMKLLTAPLPAGWSARPGSTSMRMAEATLPAAPGDPEDGELIVYFFGPGQGGTVEANLDRWYGQFTQPDGRPSREAARFEKFKTAGMQVVLIDVSGTMEPSAMPGRPPTPRREGWGMFAAIVTTAQGPVFLKATGPERTLGIHHEAMLEMLHNVRVK